MNFVFTKVQAAPPNLSKLVYFLTLFFNLIALKAQAQSSDFHTVVAITETRSYLSCPYEMNGHSDRSQNARDRISICLSGDGYYDAKLLQTIGSKDWFPSKHFTPNTVNEVRVVCSDRQAEIPEIAQAIFPSIKETRRGRGIRLEIPCHFKPSQALAAMESLQSLVFTAKMRPEKFMTQQLKTANECANSPQSKSCTTHLHALAAGILGQASQPMPGYGLRFNQYALFNFGLTDAPRARLALDPLGLGRWIKNIYLPLDKEAGATERFIIKTHALLDEKIDRNTTCNDEHEFSDLRRGQCIAKVQKLTSLLTQMGVVFHPGGKISLFDKPCIEGFVRMNVDSRPPVFDKSAICAASVIIAAELDELLSVIAAEALAKLKPEQFIEQKYLETLLPSGATLDFEYGGWHLENDSDAHLCNTHYACHLNSAWVNAQIEKNYISKFIGKHTIISASYDGDDLDLNLLSE